MIASARIRPLPTTELPLPSPTLEVNGSRRFGENGTSAAASEFAATKFLDGGCLHELFEAQAAATPDAEALVYGSKRFTYQMLNSRANRIAAVLGSLGVGPEVLVGIFLERSPDMVSAILGVLKAGGAYLPMDKSYPSEYLSFMLRNVGADLVLTQSSLLGVLQSYQDSDLGACDIVCVDNDPRVARANGENPRSAVGPQNLAYVIHTSGSTGEPKAVAIEHHNSVALIRWASKVYSPRELDGVLAGTSICFDPSILDLFVPLSLGGKVIMAPDALALRGLETAREVRLIYSVPSVMRELLRIGGLPASLETINLGGEPLPAQLVDQLYRLPHVKRVYDLYGPTEATTCSIFALRTPGGPDTIGKPIAGTEAHLLDAHLRPVADGESGELFIGGAGVARGYFNHPDATAERFIEIAPHNGHSGRLYRTGDFCRRRADGNLEFIGRQDRQVKVRGFRVELGEIESALLGHPVVEQTVVIAKEEAPGDRRLVAYVVPRMKPGERASEPATGSSIVSQLRSHLKGRLPDYMFPGTFMLLGRFELTANGKINKESLPAPMRSRAAEDDCHYPRTSTEALLCEIWASLLGLKQISVHDDFFELGGDSLLGVAMLVEIEQRTGHRLPVAFMQQMRTVDRLAACLDKMGKCCRPALDSPLVGIQPRGTRTPLFLVHGVGGGMLWGYENLSRHLGTDQPVFAFKPCDVDRLDEFDTVRKLATYFVRELRRFQPEGPYALGGYCFGGNVAHEMACLLDQEGQSVSLVALIGSSPRNSSYDRIRWTAPHLFRFFGNLGHWAVGFTRWTFAKQLRFVRWKIRGLRKKAARRFRLGPTAAAGNVDGLLDLSAVPSTQRGLWLSHVRALDRHRAAVYRGKVLLLRSQGHRLNCSYDGKCGWGDYAMGGVDVRVVPGFHDGLLEEPFAESVARELKLQLDAVQADASPRQ
jgi:amino acid adenylation domain-containing protein